MNKIYLKGILLFFILILFTFIIFGFDWPLQSFTQQHPINGTIGEIRGNAANVRFHNGTDIGGGDGTAVFPIESGTAFRGGTGRNRNIRVENPPNNITFFYVHLMNLINDDPDGNGIPEGAPVTGAEDASQQTPATRIGDILTGQGHVHLTDPGENPLRMNDGLDPFVDNTRPVIRDEIEFRRNPYRFNNVTNIVAPNELSGRVDIVVNAGDTRLNANGNDAGGNVAPFDLSYKILDIDDNVILDDVRNIVFDSAPPDANAIHIFGHNSVFINLFWYIVTNHPTEAPLDRFWNTKQRIGQDDINVDALVNMDPTFGAKFPDGKMKVVITARDVDHDGQNSNDPNDSLHEKTVLVDNFRPYVKKVTISEAGGEILYEAEWTFDGTNLQYGPETNPDDNIKKAANGDADVKITIETSEPMQFLRITNIQPLAFVPILSSAQPENRKTIWQGMLPKELLQTNQPRSGKQMFTIMGRDLADNDLLAISKPDDIDPATAMRDNNGIMPATGGTDTIHRFAIAQRVAFVIDDTGSMGGEIASVKAELQTMINDLDDDPDIFPEYFLISFKDFVNFRGKTQDKTVIQNLVNALFASGGGDCPEFSVAALSTLPGHMPKGGTAIFATDASPQSGEGALNFMISNLQASDIKVDCILTGDCPPPPSAAFFSQQQGSVPEESASQLIQSEDVTDGFGSVAADFLSGFDAFSLVAEQTGGNFFFITDLDFESAFQVVISDIQLNGQVLIRDAADAQMYVVPIDSSISEVFFSLKERAGAAVSLSVQRPDGTPLDASDPDVTFLSGANFEFFKVLDPAAGDWTSEVTGSGDFSLDVAGNTPIVLSLSSTPNWVFEEPEDLQAVLSGDTLASVVFNLIALDGTVITVLSLFDDGVHNDFGAGDGIYGGTFTPSTDGRFRLQALGAFGNGEAFAREDRTVITVSRAANIAVSPASISATIDLGEMTSRTLIIENSGSDTLRFNILEITSSTSGVTVPAILEEQSKRGISRNLLNQFNFNDSDERSGAVLSKVPLLSSAGKNTLSVPTSHPSTRETVTSLLSSPIRSQLQQPPGDVLNFGAYPGTRPLGITEDLVHEELLVADIEDGNIYRFDKELNFLDTFPSPWGTSNLTVGIAFNEISDTTLFVLNDLTQVIETDLDGNPVGPAFTVPGGSAVFPAGIAFDSEGDGGNGSLWYIDIANDDIFEVDLAGNLLRTFPHPLAIGTIVFGNGLDVTNPVGFIDVLGGTVVEGQVTNVFVIDKDGNDIGISPTSVLPTGDTFINDVVRSIHNDKQVLYLVGRATNTIFEVETNQLFDIPWLSTSVTAGEVLPGASLDVTVELTTDGISSEGVQQAGVLINSNDPDEQLTRIPVELIVSGCLPDGDVNEDGAITPEDALLALQIFLGTHSPVGCEFIAADVNCSGEVTPVDALTIFEAFQGTPIPPCGTTLAKTTQQESAVSELSLGQVNGAPGDTIAVPIQVDNPQGLAAFGLNLSFPEELLEYLEVSKTTLTREWFAVEGNAIAGGVVRLGGFHTKSIPSSNFGAILEVRFVVKQNVKGEGRFEAFNLADGLANASSKAENFSTKELVPEIFALYQNYPNPFNPDTNIRFDIPDLKRENVNVRLSIYNISGQLVRVLLDEERAPGSYEIQWNGQDERGKLVTTGVYFYTMAAGDFKTTKKMLVLK